MEYDYSIAVEYNNKRINELIETTESNQRRINELTDKLNAQDDINAEILKKINKLSFSNIKTNDKQVEVNKHINDKFRKVWDCINADHLRLEAVEKVITETNDKLDCVNDKTDFCVIKINDKIDDRLDKLEAQERALTSIIEDNSCDIAELQDAVLNNEAEVNQDVINIVLNDFLNDVKKLLNDNTQTIKSDNKTRFVNVHNIQLIVDRYANNNNINLSNKGGN